MIEVERRALGWYVVYAGTILFIGAKAEAVTAAKWCAKKWRVKVRLAGALSAAGDKSTV